MEHEDVLVETEEQFWEELDDIVSTPCRTHDRIDDTLRTWLEFTAQHKEEYLHTEDDIARCSLTLLESSLYTKHTDYVRRQLLHCLLQEDDAPTLHLLAVFLLYDGKYHEQTFVSMTEEGSFPRLVQLIKDGTDDELGLHRVLVELMYEMSRIQEVAIEELATIDDEFILYLFQIVEGLSDNAEDPYHYPVIRVLLVLNEQYMVAAHDPAAAKKAGGPLTNRVIKVLSSHGSAYKTFGENMIYLLNREGETSSQLLILKLLYLLFTNPSTQEYFYTNDLHVLVDILIRNLLDLPADADPLPSPLTDAKHSPSTPTSLRHTYLRVLHPLLAYTQLRLRPHYKRNQLRNALFLLADATHNHFSRPDETTVRLVGRCINVSWLRSEEDIELAIACASSPTESVVSSSSEFTAPESLSTFSAPPPARSATHPDTSSPATSRSGRVRPKPPPPRPLVPRALSGIPGLSSKGYHSSQKLEREVRAGQAVVAKKLLGMNLAEGRESNTSLVEMAGLREAPGVLAPSRARERRESGGLEQIDEAKMREGHAEEGGEDEGRLRVPPVLRRRGSSSKKLEESRSRSESGESSGGWSTAGESDDE